MSAFDIRLHLHANTCLTLTIAVCASCYLPQHQPKGPDVHSLVSVEAVCLNGLVQYLRGHVALGAHLWIVAHIQQIVCLRVCYSQPWNTQT